MTETDDTKSIDELIRPGSTLMVGTATADRQSFQFRPLTAARVADNVVEILIDTSAEWTETLSDGQLAYMTVSDTRDNTWVSCHGTLATTQDPDIIDELWNPMASAYFDDGRDTFGITVLRIKVLGGSYWTTPSGRVGSAISIIKAVLGSPDESGTHGQVA